MGAYLGIDWGQRRTGVACSDPEGRVAFPLEHIEHDGQKTQLREILRIRTERAASTVVVGYPLQLGGDKGASARSTEKLMRRLKGVGGFDVILWDERLSSREASRRLSAQGFSSREQGDKIDTVAATLILQSFLDDRNRSEEGPSGAAGAIAAQEYAS